MKPFNIIRLLIAAFTTAVNTNAQDEAALKASDAKNEELQKALDELRQQNTDALGEPLTTEEQSHLNELLGAAQDVTPPATPVSAPPTPPTVPAEPAVVDQSSVSSSKSTVTETAPAAAADPTTSNGQ